jgi:hypothetical protein
MFLNGSGMWRDKEGGFKHPDVIGVDKQLEDEVVTNLVTEAKEMERALIAFKTKAFEGCQSFIDLLRQNYNMDRLAKSETGAVTLKSFDGTTEVQIQVAKLITFDAKLRLAKEKFDEYFTEKTEHADPEIRTLITRAFEVRNGKVDVKLVLSLKSYAIKNPKWLEAMKLIDDATEIAGTKSYIRFKERANGNIDGELRTIILNIAAIELED